MQFYIIMLFWIYFWIFFTEFVFNNIQKQLIRHLVLKKITNESKNVLGFIHNVKFVEHAATMYPLFLLHSSRTICMAVVSWTGLSEHHQSSFPKRFWKFLEDLLYIDCAQSFIKNIKLLYLLLLINFYSNLSVLLLLFVSKTTMSAKPCFFSKLNIWVWPNLCVAIGWC